MIGITRCIGKSTFISAIQQLQSRKMETFSCAAVIQAQKTKYDCNFDDKNIFFRANLWQKGQSIRNDVCVGEVIPPYENII